MSPEQAAGERELDGRSDVYSLGCVLYEMLAGQPPFVGPSVESVVRQHIAVEASPVTNLRPTVPNSVAATLGRTLAKTPADRFATAGQLAEALAEAGLRAARGDSTAEALERHHPARVAALFGLASVGVVGVVYSLMQLLGLPDWVLPSTIVLLAVGLPIVMSAARIERERARMRATGEAAAAGGGPERWLTWRRAMLGGVLAFASLGLAVTAYSAMRMLGIGPYGTLVATGALQEREPLVLAEFENRTDDSTLAYAVTQLFRVGLDQSPVVDLLDPGRVVQVLQRMDREADARFDLPLAIEVAEREGLKAVIAGEIIAVGSGFVLSARVMSASGEVLTAQQESADDADGIIPAVGRLSSRMRERIGESLRTIRRAEALEQVTTGSLQALRLYSQGLRAENEGDFGRALRLLDEAVGLDTGFAMAHRKIGVILGNTREQPTRRTEAVTNAFVHRDRLTEVERYRAVGMYHLSVTEQWEAAIDAYRTLLELAPEDTYALNNLAFLYWSLRDNARAEEFALRALEADPSEAASYWNLAETRFLQGKDTEAQATLERFALQFPGGPSVMAFRAWLEAARGSHGEAERRFRELRDAQRGSLFWEAAASEGLAQVATLKGRLRDAAGHWAAAVAATEQRELPGEYLALVARRALADLVVSEQPARGLEHVERALRRYPLESVPILDRPYQALVLLHALTGDEERAGALLAEYEASGAAEHNRQARALHHHARGAVALAEGRPDEAIDEFQESDDGPCMICALPWLARSYDVAGHPDSALALYERYVSTPWLERLAQDHVHLAVAYRRLGELYEERGDTERAVEYYNRFVELWKDADPELQPQVADVRQRIAGLVGEPRGG
jgi:tetratricopeptide (TPR) repeat protein